MERQLFVLYRVIVLKSVHTLLKKYMAKSVGGFVMIYRSREKFFFLSLFFVTQLFCGNGTSFYLGIENMSPALIDSMRPHRVGLVTNQTGVDQSGQKTVDLLKKNGIFVQALFAPEHGIEGVVPAGEVVHDDQVKAIPIISLYRTGVNSKTIGQEVFNTIDIIVFDVQDSGMRHYTYISTLFELLKAAASFDKKVVVFDRPNPLGGIMEGPLVEPELKSFISIASIPVRHGLTIGELALYFNKSVLDKPASLHVVKMKGYNRSSGSKGELLKELSPNIACKASCDGYSFLGLLGEIEPFYVGVGTDKAFQYIMLPKKLGFSGGKWHSFSELLNQMHIGNSVCSYFDARKNQLYEGVQIQIKDINTVRSFTTFIRIVSFFKEAGVSLKFAKLFDKAIGTSLVRKVFEDGGSKKDLVEKVNTDLKIFFNQARHAFLYEPAPQMVNIVI